MKTRNLDVTHLKQTKGTDVASAAVLPLKKDGNYFDVTGTNAITSIKSLGIGTTVTLHFDGILTLTHHATDLILPGAVNIVTAAGDEATFVEYAAGDWRCVNYSKASGEPVRLVSTNTETLAAAKTLVVSDSIAQWLDPGGADRDVTLPDEASSTNLMFIILNTADGSGEDLAIKNAAATTIATLGPGMSGIFSCNGTAWKWENESGVFYDKVSGFRGIGTVTPLSKLHIRGYTSEFGLWVDYGNAGGQVETISLRANGIHNGRIGIQMVDGSNGDLWLGGSSGRAMTVYRNGYIGIGNIAPPCKLTIDNGTIGGNQYSNQQSNGASFDILGLCTNPVFFNLLCEDPSGGVMTDISGAGHNGTYYGTMTAGDRVNKGSGWAVDYDGVDDYVSLGDHADFSFGDGLADVPFTIFGAVQIVDTGGNQMIITKWDETTGAELREWIINLNSIEKMGIFLYDESANVYCSRSTDASLSIGWHTLVITCSSVSAGASRADDILIYIDGAVVASTASNNANYVAMENLAVPCWIGAYEDTTGAVAGFMTGDMTGLGIEKGYVFSAMDVRRFHLKMKALLNL